MHRVVYPRCWPLAVSMGTKIYWHRLSLLFRHCHSFLPSHSFPWLQLSACPKAAHAVFVSRQPALQPPERPVRTQPLIHQNGSLLRALHARLRATPVITLHHSASCSFLSFPPCASPQGCSSWPPQQLFAKVFCPVLSQFCPCRCDKSTLTKSNLEENRFIFHTVHHSRDVR